MVGVVMHVPCACRLCPSHSHHLHHSNRCALFQSPVSCSYREGIDLFRGAPALRQPRSKERAMMSAAVMRLSSFFSSKMDLDTQVRSGFDLMKGKSLDFNSDC